MLYKKFFMPIGGGDELKERVYGALLVAKHFNVHLEILHSMPGIHQERELPHHIVEELEKIALENREKEAIFFNNLLKEITKEIDVEIHHDTMPDKATVHTLIQVGNRSTMVEKESKFCDLVVAAAPPHGETTATFEAAVMHSGKPVIVIPRIMKKFDTQNIIIAWNNSEEIARAITQSMHILKNAKKVHLVSTIEYSNNGEDLDLIEEYLEYHNINVTKQLIKTKLHPGQALLETAQEGKFDMIVAGAYNHKGLREIVFGGTTKYLLKNSDIPVFMSH
jgi:nucleotide-binding universal stress UspA family protein